MASTWLAAFDDVPAPVCELVCIPHAGGGTTVFHNWQRLTDNLRVSAVRLPGRELRLSEPPISEIGTVVDALATALARFGERPYAIYGHSMGALIAFELTRRMRAAGAPLPTGLFVAGLDAPHLLDLDRANDLPREELIAWLGRYHGLDPEVLRYPELIDLMLPSIRADLAIVENYRYQPRSPLPVPIHVFHGRADRQVTRAGSAGWGDQTTAGCVITELDGDHFFVHEHEHQIVELIETDLLAEGATR